MVADFGGWFCLCPGRAGPGVIRLSLALERRPQLSLGCMDLFVYIVVLFPDAAASTLPPLPTAPFHFNTRRCGCRLSKSCQLPASVAAAAVAAGKCEHFGQHSQVVAGELAQKVLVMMILNYS